MIDAPGEPFHDPAADAALFGALREGLHPDVERVELPVHINDPSFGLAMANRLDQLIRGDQGTRPGSAVLGGAAR